MTDTKIQIRISIEEKERWQRESEELGVTLTDYIKGKVGGSVMTEGGKGGEVVMTEKKEWSGPVFKDEKLNTGFKK